MANGFTGEGLTERQREAQALTRKLLNWRKTATAIHGGKLTQYNPEGQIYVYFRHDDRQTIMVVINKSHEEESLDPARLREVLAGAEAGRDVLTDRIYPFDSRFAVPADTALALEVN